MSGMNTACRHQCWLQECPQETDLPICLRTDESPSPVKRPKLHGTWRPPPLRRSAEMAQLEPPSRSPPVASPGELSPAPLPHHWECHPTCRGDPCRHGPGGANRTPDESPELTCSHGQESVCPWKDETQGVRPLRVDVRLVEPCAPWWVHAGRAGVRVTRGSPDGLLAVGRSRTRLGIRDPHPAPRSESGCRPPSSVIGRVWVPPRKAAAVGLTCPPQTFPQACPRGPGSPTT